MSSTEARRCPTLPVEMVARESPADGQYYVQRASSVVLTIDARTLTLSSGAGPLLHVPLAACLFGAAADRLLIVPISRAPVWVLTLSRGCEEAANALRAAGCAIESGGGAAPAITEEALVAAAASPGFGALVSEMEAALARRHSLGLGELQLS